MASPAGRTQPTFLLLLLFTTTTTLVSSHTLLPFPTGQRQTLPVPIPLLPVAGGPQQPIPTHVPGGGQQPIPTPLVGVPGLKSFTNGKGFYKRMAREFLHAHNHVRGRKGEAPYRWNKRIARFARRWTETRRAACTMVHSQGPYGENMFWGTGWDWRASDAVASWAAEESYYIRENNSCLPGQMCGHFTQVVWNTTVRIGCARVECYAGGVIISCNYDPPGNWLNESPFGYSV